MRPLRVQYVLAHAYKIAMGSGALLLAVVVAVASGGFSVWSVVATIVALPLGSILGALFFGPFIFAIASKLNGSPFHEGDVVRILTGPHRDRVTRIYEMWRERNQARVDLGEAAQKDVTDVFGYTEICRERDA
jgi:hypothetical protein